MAFTQPDSPPAVAEALLRLLRQNPTGVPRKDLIALLAPWSGRPSSAVSMVIKDLRDCGALQENGDALLLSNRAEGESTNRAAIRDCLFETVDPEAFWEKKDGALKLEGGVDLVRALAWFCSLDAFAGPYSYKDARAPIVTLQARELDTEVVATKERWLPFARWAAYLGFVRFDAGDVSVDPTQAVADSLADAAQAKVTWEMDELAGLVAQKLPVMENGRFAVAIQKRIETVGGAERPEQASDVSSGLALALLTLEAEGRVELAKGTGDAKKARFPHELGAYHAVTWKGVA